MAPRFFPLTRGSQVYSGWGNRDGSFHSGLDFGREGGSVNNPVHAAQGGTVQYAGASQWGQRGAFGQWVVIDHPTADGGGTTVYGHTKPAVTPGQRVEAGQLIGYVAESGPGNGYLSPHCHFEVHKTVWTTDRNGRTDPAPWLQGARYVGDATPAPTPTPERPVTDLQYGIDISNHQGNMDIARVAREGFVAVLAKASEGSTYVDPYFARNRDLTRANGMTFVGYHYVRSGDPQGNARCWDRAVGGDKSIPCMLDFEDGSGRLTDYWAVRKAIEDRGYRVVLAYIPRWYWQGAMGGGDLSNVGPVMASSYSTADGTASGIYDGGGKNNWQQYGGANVAILQFTDKAQVAGQRVDAWAFKGSRAQLDSVLTGTTVQEDDVPLTDADIARIWEFAINGVNARDRLQGIDTVLNDKLPAVHHETTQWLDSRNSPSPKHETALGFALEAYDAASRAEANTAEILKLLKSKGV